MVEFTSEPLDCRVGDIVVERYINGPTAYWVVTQVVENDNPFRWGHIYGKMYWVFNLANEEEYMNNIIFRSTDQCTYEIIRG